MTQPKNLTKKLRVSRQIYLKINEGDFMIGAIGNYIATDYYYNNRVSAIEKTKSVLKIQPEEQKKQEKPVLANREDTITVAKNDDETPKKTPAQQLTNEDFPEFKDKLQGIQKDWEQYQGAGLKKADNSNAQNALGVKNNANENNALGVDDKADKIDSKGHKTAGLTDEECATCDNRKYVDVSNDESVSFQIPTKISKGQAEAQVRAHENQHVVNEQQKAQEDGRRVVSQSVTIQTATCPECGDSYVAGGVTKTITASAGSAQKSTSHEHNSKIDNDKNGNSNSNDNQLALGIKNEETNFNLIGENNTKENKSTAQKQEFNFVGKNNTKENNQDQLALGVKNEETMFNLIGENNTKENKSTAQKQEFNFVGKDNTKENKSTANDKEQKFNTIGTDKEEQKFNLIGENKEDKKLNIIGDELNNLYSLNRQNYPDVTSLQGLYIR
ncbi:hypothetical protein FACS1894132_00300 [Clostridia bacterium]|nr:hypothetical protein FACS1894132_00300 [Clostridia bacterium]